MLPRALGRAGSFSRSQALALAQRAPSPPEQMRPRTQMRSSARTGPSWMRWSACCGPGDTPSPRSFRMSRQAAQAARRRLQHPAERGLTGCQPGSAGTSPGSCWLPGRAGRAGWAAAGGCRRPRRPAGRAWTACWAGCAPTCPRSSRAARRLPRSTLTSDWDCPRTGSYCTRSTPRA